MSFFLVNHDLGSISFDDAYLKQLEIRQKIHEKKTSPFHLIFCEHHPTFTLGRNFTKESLLISKEECAVQGIAVKEVDRGGDITYHGPGQLTAYFLFDLNCWKKDVHLFIRSLETLVMNVLQKYNIESHLEKKHTGVWVGNNKICAIGVGFKHWVSYHGIGLNVSNDRFGFDMIVPCGIQSKGVTSLKLEKPKAKICMKEIKIELQNSVCDLFGLTLEDN